MSEQEQAHLTKLTLRGPDFSYEAEGSEEFISSTSESVRRMVITMRLEECQRVLRQYREWERKLKCALAELSSPRRASHE